MSPIPSIVNDLTSEFCPLCGSQHIHKLGSISYEQLTIFSTTEINLELVPELWSCSQCHSAFVQNRVREDMAIKLYSNGESAERWSREPFHIQKPINQIECLNRYFLDGKKILDIGCNSGELLDYAQSLGCVTAGVEYSKDSRNILKDKGHTAFPSMSDVDDKFDVITAFDLVEHLYDIPTFFSRCQNNLNKDGVLIILTGNVGSLSAKLCKAEWWYVRFPEHVVFPSQKYFAHYSGFSIVGWIRTYATKYYKHTWTQVMRGVLGGIRQGAYNGFPPIGSDHVIVVLKKYSES